MQRERKIYKNVPDNLNWVAMADLDYEVNEVRHCITMPIYQCPNSKMFVIFFEPEDNVLIIGTSQDFYEAGTNLKDNLIDHYRKKK